MRSGRRTAATGSSHLNRVSLPGLSLSAAVVVAALIARAVLETSDDSPAGYSPPPDGNAIVRLSPGGQIGVAGRQASSRARKGRRGGGAQSLALLGLDAVERARAAALARERGGRNAPRRRAARRKAARRRSGSQRGS